MTIGPIPYFPVPPPTYSQQYLAEITRAFSTFAAQITNPAIAKPVLIEIPTSAQSSDEVGTVYESNTILRIKSATAANNNGDKGQPCRTPLVATKLGNKQPLTRA